MPSVSRAERTAMAIAEHHPEKLYARNRGLLRFSHQQLHDFASTPEKDLPEYKGDRKDKQRKGDVSRLVGRPHRGGY